MPGFWTLLQRMLLLYFGIYMIAQSGPDSLVSTSLGTLSIGLFVLSISRDGH